MPSSDCLSMLWYWIPVTVYSYAICMCLLVKEVLVKEVLSVFERVYLSLSYGMHTYVNI